MPFVVRESPERLGEGAAQAMCLRWRRRGDPARLERRDALIGLPAGARLPVLDHDIPPIPREPGLIVEEEFPIALPRAFELSFLAARAVEEPERGGIPRPRTDNGG